MISQKGRNYMHDIKLCYPCASNVFNRGVAGGGGGSWGSRDPPLVGLLLRKQPTIFRWRKRHDNIMVVKGIVEKSTFLKFVFFVNNFRQRLSSLVNTLHAAMTERADTRGRAAV